MCLQLCAMCTCWLWLTVVCCSSCWLALVGFGCGLVDWLGLMLSAWRSLVGAWFSCW